MLMLKRDSFESVSLVTPIFLIISALQNVVVDEVSNTGLLIAW
jgi:hypothetical protein